MTKLICLTILIITGFLTVQPVLAYGLEDPVLEGLNYATIAGYGTQDIRVAVGKTINIILGFLGIVAIIIVLWGGFRWMTAGGNEEKVRAAKGILVAGMIGLAIVLLAYAIATFVAYSLTNIVTTP